MKKILIAIFGFMMFGCSSDNMDIATIPDFELEKYMGKWYEIARIDTRFQRGMVNVTAEYTLRPDGKVEVLNRGYQTEKGKYKKAEAIAYTTDVPNHLKVSFFPLVKSDYWVAYIDDDYSVAVVSGGKDDYLWFLARENVIPNSTLKKLLEVAEGLGYDTSHLIYNIPDNTTY